MFKHSESSGRMMSDREIWRQARDMPAPEDEGERFLALASFAEGCADADEEALVAEWLAQDPELSGDIAAATQFEGEHPAEATVSRAMSLVPDAPAGGEVIRFRPPRPHRA
jgi:hypothetical protein